MGEYLFIASAMFCLLNGIVLLCVNPQRMVNQVFFAGSVWIALWLSCVAAAIQQGSHYTSGSDIAPLFWLRLSSVVGAFFVWLIALMRIVLIDGSDQIGRILSQSWPWFVLSCALATLALTQHFIPSHSTPLSKTRGAGYGIYAATISTCCLWQLFSTAKVSRTLTGIRKFEMQAFVLSWIAAGLLVVLCNALGLYMNLGWLRRSGAIWFTVLHALAIWAVCYHRIFDAKYIIFSFGQRLLLFGILGVSAVILGNQLSHVLEQTWSMTLAAFLACTMAVNCDRACRRWLALEPEHRLLAPRRQIIEWAREGIDESKLTANFENLLRDWCRTDVVTLFSKDHAISDGPQSILAANSSALKLLTKEGWVTLESLNRKKPEPGSEECRGFLIKHGYSALLAAPKGSLSPTLLVALGTRRSLRPYTYPDIQTLLALMELMDNILTHSRVANHVAQLERMASATMISRGLAHDLNNLATPVSSFLTHMEQKVTPGTIDATVLIDAKTSIKVMQDYIKESLFFARKLVPNFTAISARSLLHDVIRLSLERARMARVEVILRGDPDFTFVADAALLCRLLQNLIFNGIDASGKNDEVEISATMGENNLVCLQVSDRGPGIPADIRQRIFEPYYTTKDSGGERRGLGLGLAICQKIAELHSGRILVSANMPHGAVFTVTFPMMKVTNATSSNLAASAFQSNAAYENQGSRPGHSLNSSAGR